MSAPTSTTAHGAATCRFRSSHGNAPCGDRAYAEGFCRFHYECFLRGEVLANGQINELLTDQNRRRTINFHGQPKDEAFYVNE